MRLILAKRHARQERILARHSTDRPGGAGAVWPPGRSSRSDARPQAAARVAVKVFVEQQMVAEIRILLSFAERRRPAARRPSPRKNKLVSRRLSSCAPLVDRDESPEPVGHSTLKSSP